jgi:hypothetical protein
MRNIISVIGLQTGANRDGITDIEKIGDNHEKH